MTTDRGEALSDYHRETPDIESSTDAYARRFGGAVGAWMLGVQWDAVYALLHDCPGREVLELGGGHGQLTGGLLERGYHTTILGSDEGCAHRLKPYLDRPACRFHTGDLLNLPYADRSFDTVIALRMMAHLEDWPRFIEEACRVARHAVIVDYPSLVSVNRIERLLFGVKKAIEKDTRHYRCFTTRTIADAGRNHGFVPDGQQKQFFMPMVVHRALKQPKVSGVMERVCRGVGLTGALGSPAILKLARQQEAQPTAGAIEAKGSAA